MSEREWQVKEWWDGNAGAWRVQLRAPEPLPVAALRARSDDIAKESGYSVRHGDWYHGWPAPFEEQSIITEYEAAYTRKNAEDLSFDWDRQ